MPIDITAERVISLTEATKIIPPRNGKRVAIATLWRWCRKGVRGIHLEYVRMGRNLGTSNEALSRFFNALAAADRVPQAPPAPVAVETPRATPAVVRASTDEANRILDAAGI